jgi:hypothetical protein
MHLSLAVRLRHVVMVPYCTPAVLRRRGILVQCCIVPAEPCPGRLDYYTVRLHFVQYQTQKFCLLAHTVNVAN